MILVMIVIMNIVIFGILVQVDHVYFAISLNSIAYLITKPIQYNHF